MSLIVEALNLQRTDGVSLLGPLNLSLARGDRLGLVGESGSGKSLLVQALFGVLPLDVCQWTGSISAYGIPMNRLGQNRDNLRDRRLAWVPQDPLQALSPLLTVGEHLTLLAGIHLRESSIRTLDRLGPLLTQLGLPTRSEFLERFPHQLSGGQRQRLGLALALSCDPELLVLDEPTTALDPLAQRAFLDLVLQLHRERGLGVLWITHDLALASVACDRLLVLYGGQLMEAGPAARLLTNPGHPYTARLLAAARHQESPDSNFLPAPQDRPGRGCAFRPRCPRTQDRCVQEVPWRGTASEGLRCFHPLEPLPAP